MPIDSPAPPVARRKRRDAAENRAALILGAATVLNRDPAATLEAIAAEAGLSRRSVYGHFATRDDLLLELTVSGAARINAALLDVVDQGRDDDPAGRLAAVAGRLWDEVYQVRSLVLLTLRGPSSRLVGDALDPLRKSVSDIVTLGVERGRFRSDIAPDRLSRLIESAAIDVLEEANRYPLPADEGRRLVMLSVLSLAGLGFREAEEQLASLPHTPLREIDE